jgi:cytochrome c-type biogenesis protein CcmH
MRPTATLLAAVLLALLAGAMPSIAVQPDEVLDDPALESRAREISAELRCVVCQNQSIDDSDAEIARDLRLLVRERLVAGDSDEQVVAYIVARYGDFVLLRPPFQANTLALWLAPPIMAVVMATLAILYFQTYQRRRAAGTGLDPLSPSDRAELDALVERIAASDGPPPPRSRFRNEIEEGLRRPGDDEEEDTEADADDAGPSDPNEPRPA